MIMPSGINEELLMRAITDFHEEIERQSGYISSPITIIKEYFYCFMTENRVMVIGRAVKGISPYPWYAAIPWYVVEMENFNGFIIGLRHSWENVPRAEAIVSTYQYDQGFTDVSDYGRLVLSTFMI